MAELHDGIPLTELGVITRWSLAVRQPQAERADLIAELKADLAWLERAGRGGATTRSETVEPPRAPTPLRRLPREPEAASPPPAAKSAPAKVAPAKVAPPRSAPAKAAPARSVPAKSTPAKSAAPAKSAVAKSAPVKSPVAKKTPSKSTR